MARGDVTIFNEAKAKMFDGNWASTLTGSLRFTLKTNL